MWIKLDDGFATHPKLLAAGPIPTLIQIRAICYASQNKTDGFIPHGAVRLLLSGFEQIGMTMATIGTLAELGCDADEIDWPPAMVKYGLWEPRDEGYYIHDYLEWNLSKKQQELFLKKKSQAGRKGMKARWGKGSRSITPVITNDITQSYHPTSTSISILSSQNSSDLKSDEFELFWAAYPKKIGKKDARKAWLQAKDKPSLEIVLKLLEAAQRSAPWQKEGGQFIPHPATWLNQGRWDDEYRTHSKGQSNRPPPPPPKNDPIGRGQWGQTWGDPKQYGYD